MRTIRETSCALAFAACALLASVDASATTPKSGLALQLPTVSMRSIEWAEAKSADALRAGTPLPAPMAALARKVGVRDPSKVRVMVVEEIPLPDEPMLRRAARQVGIAPASAAGLTLGYAVLVRRGFEADARLMSHELRHVAQYEAMGGLRPFLSQHLVDLTVHGYENSPFEVDARRHEVE
ncbi:MAG TPA: hypothetical protein VFK48_12025 [Usitatibacter sp.]|nr:hypothetical protein [Usitatibacter sp.]